ncbi:MAG: BON domain-containing protein [Acidobacteriia bacterium]|nr:BON domain-containing protein [Terriglobia bacterium]
MRNALISVAMISMAVPQSAWTAAVGTTNPVTPAPTKAPAKTAPRAKAAPARSDADIEKDIRARFARSKISVEKYQVHVQGGVATIEGKTNVIQHKGVATRLAKLGGAVAVSNHIEISEAAREKAAQNLESGRRRAQIKRGDARSETRSQTSTNSTAKSLK